ncbi:MAG: alkene reductase [Bacteroidia bacterium]
MNKSSLFQPASMGSTHIQNRIFMAPLTRSRAANADFAPTELHKTYYSQRAGAGLIITEGTVVSSQGVGYQNVPGIHTDIQTESWKQVTEAVHAKGGKIFMQLWHVGRISHPDLQNGKIPVAPSAINPNIEVYTPAGKRQSVEPLALSQGEIKAIVQDFAKAGANAMKAGFDGVEIHSSNGYLFHQFFSNCSNQRMDNYGGTYENKARILFETIDALSAVVPSDKIGLRLNPMMHGSMGIVVDEHTAPTFEYIIDKLNNYNLAYLHLSRPWTAKSEQYFIEDVIGHFRKIYRGFLIANGNYNPTSAAEEISAGRADAIAFGRPFIANPDLTDRIKNDWPLAVPDPKTFYTPGEKGYTDYPLFQ